MYVNIGYTKKTHGLSGELKMFVEAAYVEDFLKNERIFLDVKGMKVPYFITNIRGTNEFIVQLEEVGSKDAAYALQSREIFLREKDLIPAAERELEVEEEPGMEYERLAGYLLIDKALGEIGVIDEVLEMPQQEMAFMKYRKRDVLIPLNKNLIVEIDEAARRVVVDLPEGLLEV